MFELNATMVIFMLSFLVFISLLNSLFLQPVGEAIEYREKKITDDNQLAAERREDAKAVVDKYEKKLAEIREEAQKVINDSQAEAQKERSEKLALIEKEGRAKFDSAKTSLQAEKKSLVKGLVNEEIQLVSEIVSKLVGKATTVDLNHDKVEKALEEAR